MTSTSRTITFKKQTRQLILSLDNIVHKRDASSAATVTYSVSAYILVGGGSRLVGSLWTLKASFASGGTVTIASGSSNDKTASFSVSKFSSFTDTMTLTATDEEGSQYVKKVNVTTVDNGADGADGADGRSIVSADVMYIVCSPSNTPTKSSSGWVTTFDELTLQDGYYVWTGTLITYSDTTSEMTGIRKMGDCSQYADIEEQYCVTSEKTVPPDSGWGTTYTAVKGSWLWQRNKITYTSSTIVYADVRCLYQFPSDGAKGETGDDAVAFTLNPGSIVHKYTGSSSASYYTIDGTLTEGGTVVSATGRSQTLIDGVTLYSGTTKPRWILLINTNKEVSGTITLTATYNGESYSGQVSIRTVKDGSSGATGDRGPTMRGPYDWEQMASGFQFYAGAEGEPYIDTCVYNKNYYLCLVKHTKGSTTPEAAAAMSGTSKTWIGTSKQAIVATTILLAEHARVENLSAEWLEMYLKDANGDYVLDEEGKMIPVFTAYNGDVTCNTGTFNNITSENAKFMAAEITDSTLKDVVITGSLRSPWTSSETGKDTGYGDNVVMGTFTSEQSGDQKTWYYKIPHDTLQSGRKIRIINYDWRGADYYNYVTLNGADTPGGSTNFTYFFEDGSRKTALGIREEIVELVGYGDTEGYMERTYEENGYNYVHMERYEVYLEEGETYTLTGETNGVFTDVHDATYGEKRVTIWIENSTKNRNYLISTTDMTSDGKTGAVFKWEQGTAYWRMMICFYDSGTWWVKKLKIEKGSVSTGWNPGMDGNLIMDYEHFYGWIVTNRQWIGVKWYGAPMRALAMGRVEVTTTTAKFRLSGYQRTTGTATWSGATSAKTFDGQSMAISRTGTGLYQLQLPISWAYSVNDLLVQVTGEGGVYINGSKSTANACKATVLSIESTVNYYYVRIATSDDDSLNDGDFNFIVYNMRDWGYDGKSSHTPTFIE